MQSADSDLRHLLKLTYTAAQDQIKNVEQSLARLGQRDGFLFDLLGIIFDSLTELDIKLAAAVLFKNQIQAHWADIEQTVISEMSRGQLKARIYDCYLTCEPRVRPQFLSAILIICTLDFPSKWQSLLPSICGTLKSQDLSTGTCALRLLNSILKRFIFEEPSEAMYSDIKYVLDVFTQPFIDIFRMRLMDIQQLQSGGANDVTGMLKQMKYLIRIFLCLTVQEFPDELLELKDFWFSSFLLILKVNLGDSSEINARILEKIKTSIVKISTMFVRKYTSDFDGYARTYMETVWVLTASHLKSDQSDKLTSECLHFIKMAITTSSIRSLFEQDDNGLSGLFVNIIIPNLVPGPYDEELFEDDPIEYVRSEMDGDAESRRQAAADLVSSLAFAYEKKIIPMILQFIEQLVQKSRDSDDWKYEDAAIRLIMAVTNKFGAIKFGVAEVSPLLDVNKIYTQLIYPIFSDPKRNPMLLGSALKYTIIFRKVMNSQMVDATIACYISLMSHANFGVRYFSCIVVSELILPPNHPDANTRLLIIVEHLQTIYSHLMNLIIGQTALSDVPFQCLISLLLKTHSFSKQYIGTIMDNLLSVVVKLGSINSNPASIHSLFSSICLCFRFSFLYTNEMFNVQASKFITLANGLIMKNSCDLADYLLQTLSVIVSHFCPFELVEIKACFTRLIEVPSWEGDPSHFCSTSLLAGAFMESAPDLILGQGYYTFFIDIFERYSRNVRYDSVVFNILKPMVFLPWKRAKISFPTRVFDIVFSRLTKLKKPKFISGFVDFIYLFVMAFNSDELVKLVEGIQRLIIFRIVRGLLLPELANPISIVRKKCISIVCCQILFSISIHVAYDAKDWANDLLKLFDSNPPTQPLIRPDLIEYYKSLGNFETDLLPSFEPVPEDTMNVIRFVVPKFDHHPHVCDVKAFIKEMYETMKTGLKQEATLIIESKLKT